MVGLLTLMTDDFYLSSRPKFDDRRWYGRISFLLTVIDYIIDILPNLAADFTEIARSRLTGDVCRGGNYGLPEPSNQLTGEFLPGNPDPDT